MTLFQVKRLIDKMEDAGYFALRRTRGEQDFVIECRKLTAREMTLVESEEQWQALYILQQAEAQP